MLINEALFKVQDLTPLEAAKFLHANNFTIVPIMTREKHPIRETDAGPVCFDWRAWDSASKRLSAPTDIPEERNIGLHTGLNGVWVLDIDGAVGENSFTWLKRQVVIVDTFTILTPRGRHLYFKTSNEVPTTTRILPGIDVRGTGGVVVIPPSTHPNGGKYRVFDDRPAQVPYSSLETFVRLTINGDTLKVDLNKYDRPSVKGTSVKGTSVKVVDLTGASDI